MNPVAVSLLAETAVAAMRSGWEPDDAQARELTRLPYIDALRQEVSANDVGLLLSFAEKHPETYREAMAISMLRGIGSNDRVQNWLTQRWESASPQIRSHLYFRILENPSLGDNWKDKLREYAAQEKGVFAAEMLYFYGSWDAMLPRLVRRLAEREPRAPYKWAYLCCFSAAAGIDPGIRDVASFLAHSLASDQGGYADGYTKAVAQQLCELHE